MAIKQRDDAYTKNKAILMKQDKALPKPKANPKITELKNEIYSLRKGLRDATPNQKIQINKQMREKVPIYKITQMKKDDEDSKKFIID